MIWPIISLLIFSLMRFDRAIPVSIIAAYLFLPDNIKLDLPLLPRLDKHTVTALALVVAWPLFRHRVQIRVKGRMSSLDWLLGVYLVLLLLGAYFTVRTNPDAIVIHNSYRPGLKPYDAISMGITMLLILPPFFMARKYLATETHHRYILVAISCFTAFYSILILYEWRFSPQLNQLIYGYFPHGWKQHVRGGGFRPLVFLDHGLSLGLFLASACLASFALAKSDTTLGKRLMWVSLGFYLLVILILSRNLAATMLALMFLIVLLLFWRGLQLYIVAFVSILLLVYPAFHQSTLFPLRAVVTAFGDIAPERAHSLEFRLINEDRVMARALERPYWGWGGYARNRIFNERGKDITIIDGTWIGIFSTRGWGGYIAFFGFLTAPLLALAFRHRAVKMPPSTICLSLILAINLLYIIPNSTLTPIFWMLLGAIAGFNGVQKVIPKKDSKIETSRYVYTRFPQNSSS